MGRKPLHTKVTLQFPNEFITREECRMSVSQLAAHWGVAKSTASRRRRKLLDLLRGGTREELTGTASRSPSGSQAGSALG